MYSRFSRTQGPLRYARLLQIRSMQTAHHPRSSSRKMSWTSRGMRDLPHRERHGARRTTITTRDSMAPCPQPSHQRLSGVAHPADQELHHDHVLRRGARGAARGRER